MRKTINWQDQKNINCVITQVKNSPDNLRAAFKCVAEKLNTSEYCVAQAWYSSIRNKANGFRTKSTKVNYINVKNTPRRETKLAPIHQKVVSTKNYDGMKVVTVKQYFSL